MLKYPVLLFFAQAVIASQDVDDFRAFLVKSRQTRNTTLVDAMKRNPKAKPWENSGKYQGDIILFDHQIEELVLAYSRQGSSGGRTPRAAISDKRFLWPNNEVYYDIPSGTYNQAQLNMINEALRYFEYQTCLKWVPKTYQRDYVVFSNRPDGCYSTVGYFFGGGAHTLNLANSCFDKYTIIHEMTHSIGFHHMHQAPNRNDYVSINWDNVEPDMRYNLALESGEKVNMLELPYEYTSVMHYGKYAFSRNNQPTIIAKRDHRGVMGQKEYETRLDVLRAVRLYNCPGAWNVRTTSDDVDMPYDENTHNKIAEAAMKATSTNRG